MDYTCLCSKEGELWWEILQRSLFWVRHSWGVGILWVTSREEHSRIWPYWNARILHFHGLCPRQHDWVVVRKDAGIKRSPLLLRIPGPLPLLLLCHQELLLVRHWWRVRPCKWKRLCFKEGYRTWQGTTATTFGAARCKCAKTTWCRDRQFSDWSSCRRPNF